MPARNTIEIAVQAVDKATDILKGVGAGIESLSSTLTNVGANLTAIGAPFAGIFAAGLAGVMEAEQAVAQLDAVLKSTKNAAGVSRDELLKFADAMELTTKFSAEQVIAGENMLLTFTNIGNKVFPRATETLLDMATAMGTDAKSQAIQLGKALNDPVMGISALSRVGVTFTEDQKKMIASMVEMGDVAGAQTVILDELQKEFGGSAAAAGDTLAGKLEIVKNKIGNVTESIVAGLLPVVESLIGWVEGLIEVYNNLDPAAQQTITMIVGLGAALAVIGPIIAGVGIAISVLTGLLSGPMLPIMLVIGALVLLADHFNISFEQIKVYFSLFVLYVQYYIQQVITEIELIVGQIKAWVEAHPQLMTALILVAGFVAAVTIAVGLLNLAVGVLTGLLGLLLSPVLLIAAAIALLLFAIEELYPGGISGILKQAGTAAQQLGYILQYSLGAAVHWIRARMADLQVTFFDTALSMLQFAKEIANNPLMQAVNPLMKPLADQLNANFNQIKAGLVLAKHMAQEQANTANTPFVPPPPPTFATGTGAANPNANNELQAKIDSLLNQAQNPIQINFNGTGGPTNEAEADQAGFMVVNALKAKGLG